MLLAPSSASAHERFIKHRLKVPLHDEFFLQGPGPMGIHPDLMRIATSLSSQLDMVAPTSLMPQVFGLLQQERDMLEERATSRLLEVTTRTAITAGCAIP